MKKLLGVIGAALSIATGPALAQKAGYVTCTGILIAVDMVPRADFPMAVIYDNTDFTKAHTCVLDVGHAGHWPLRGACSEGEKCRLSGPYFKKIGQTYYMRVWDKAEMPNE